MARAWPGGPSWRRLAVLATAVFVVAMGVITAFELTTGQAVSVYTGGSDDTTDSTVPGLGRRGDRSTPGPSDTATSNPSEDGSESSSSSPTEDPTTSGEPTTEPSDATPDDATSSPVPTPTPSPSPDLTELPSSTPTG